MDYAVALMRVIGYHIDGMYWCSMMNSVGRYSTLAKRMLCQGERDIPNCPADVGRANNRNLCVKGSQIATVHRIKHK